MNTQKAAKQIGNLSGTSMEIAEKTGKLIENIVSGIQKTAELVSEISASNAEQANGIQQITQSVQQLDPVIQQNASATEEMASTSEELSAQARKLRDTASYFKVKNSSDLQASVNTGDMQDESVTRQSKHHVRGQASANPDKKERHDEKKKRVALELNELDDSAFECY